jgi:D-serine deaminase-like pyridoxal phosphate-dependent protein
VHIDNLSTPCAVVDLERLEKNATRMATRAKRLGVQLRPHVKTHKCVEAARIQTAEACGGITVSTLAEARAFAAGGFSDITYAVPIAPQKILMAIDLHTRIEAFNLVVDTLDAAAAVEAAAEARGVRIPVFLEIDCGGGRTGVDPDGEVRDVLVRRIAASEAIDFRGLLTHAGHAYRARNRTDAYDIACADLMATLAAELRDRGVPVPVVSVGATPTVLAIDDLTGITEVRPGNYLFFDAFQNGIGTCEVDEIAFSVLATVISVHPEQNRAVVDAGALALSVDPGPVHVDPECGFGRIVAVEDQHPLPGLRVARLTQEHGTLTGPGVAALKPGARLRIFPNHSCLSAACFESYHVLRGTEVVDEWHPARGW